jgi:haloacetate dehalogenase
VFGGAGATIDIVHDAADADVGLVCPLLVLWSAQGLGRDYDVPAIWKARATDLTFQSFDCGLFSAEERPAPIAGELLAFLR